MVIVLPVVELTSLFVSILYFLSQVLSSPGPDTSLKSRISISWEGFLISYLSKEQSYKIDTSQYSGCVILTFPWGGGGGYISNVFGGHICSTFVTSILISFYILPGY